MATNTFQHSPLRSPPIRLVSMRQLYARALRWIVLVLRVVGCQRKGRNVNGRITGWGFRKLDTHLMYVSYGQCEIDGGHPCR